MVTEEDRNQKVFLTNAWSAAFLEIGATPPSSQNFEQ